jgi:polysaccharide export outer membrane protein
MLLLLFPAMLSRALHVLRVVPCLAGIGLTACSTLPGSGPTTSDIIHQANDARHRFGMVELDSRVVETLASQPTVGLSGPLIRSGRPQKSVIGPGDRVTVSIWQASNGPPSTSSDSAANGVDRPLIIPDQIVGPEGAISVPFAGRVAVTGRTPLQVQTIIEQRLAQQVIQPQVIIGVTKSATYSATVSGEHVSGARVPLSVGGDRLLDVIASAGGSKSPIYETSVRLSRNGQTATIPMSALVSDPAQDVYLWPGDVITVVHTPNEFTVFGATTNNAEIPFGAERLSLAQAIAKAGGLADSRADPEGVFLFRFEKPTVVEALKLPRPTGYSGEYAPVLYHLDLRRVDGYFLAKRFAVANDDLIYVANAKLAELQKFFTLIGTITSPVIGGVVVSRSVSNH